MQQRFFLIRKKAGFTLIEAIIVIVVISILAIYASANWVFSPILDAQAQQLLNDIRYTQNLSMTHDQRFRVNLTTTTYGITTTDGTAVNNPSTNAATVTMGSGITLSFSNLPNNLIGFDEKGIPYTDSALTTALSTTATITLTYRGKTRSITIAPETGWTTVS